MYEGLYNTRKGLSQEDFELIGSMTLRLMLPWEDWVHRRVDKVTFTDEDALCRSVSIDFTLPHWFHQARQTGSSLTRQLVPLGFFRKEALINFSLSDENYASLPLLTAPQTSQVAESVLVKMAELALRGKVPTPIKHDIYGLINASQEAASKTYDRLFRTRDAVWKAREELKSNPAFASTASQFSDGFLALTMMDIACHERRVVHFSFEEQLEPSGTTLKRMVRQATSGEPQQIAIGIQSPSAAASYHLEAEAPDGLMVTGTRGYQHDGTGVNPVPATSVLRRAHFHITGASTRARAAVEVDLNARRSSVVRPALLTAILAFASTAAITARFPHIESGDNAAAAALLLAVTGVIGLIVARSGEGEMATSLLLPLRVLGITPAVLGVLAAIVVVFDPPSPIAYSVLGLILLLMVISIGLLIRNWRKIRA